MSDYSSVAPPQQNFNQSTAFAAALQRAKQIAAKINPASAGSSGSSSGGNDSVRPKRSLEDGSQEPEAKKMAPGPGRPGLGNPSIGGGMPPMGGGPQINEDIKVPDKMVGLIIGRGGEQITRLQAESGCKIQMAPDSAGTSERICSLSGSREAIGRAKELIMNIVHQRGRSEGIQGLDLGGTGMQGPPGGGGPGPQSNHGMNNSMNGRGFTEIMIPGPKVGLIIGKGGETIKQLQERSGAKMVVIQDGPNQEQEKPLRISGDPQKVEYAKQLVFELIQEKDQHAFNRNNNGGPGMGGRGGRNDDRQNYNEFNNDVEIIVPRSAVGVVIGKGGDMIKKIQSETGARVQFQQTRDEGPGERSCYLSGKPMQVEEARRRIEELIASVGRRDNEGPGGGNGRNQGRGGGRGNRNDQYDGGRGRNGNNDFNGGNNGWDDRRGGNQGGHGQSEVSFTVPASKCGVIIGRGGETIKQINQQSGAHCELDRRQAMAAQTNGDKLFIIRGEVDQIETAKRIITEKVQMPLNFVVVSGGMAQGNNAPNNLPTAYPGMAPQGYNPQGWGMAAANFQQQQQQQQWGNPQVGGQGQAGGDPTAAGQMGQAASGGAGQPDYSLQWAEYYRSLGMMREAEMIEQQAKNKQGGAAPAAAQQQAMPAQAQQHTSTAGSGATGSQPDYSAQWAEYYRSLGKHKEAEAIEAQMKNKTAPNQATQMPVQGSAVGGQYQQAYGGYQPQGYYGSQQAQGAPGMGSASGNTTPYGNFPGYGYGNGGNANPPPPQSQSSDN